MIPLEAEKGLGVQEYKKFGDDAVTAKEYLSKIFYLDKEIEAKIKLADELRSTALKATTMSPDGVHTSTISDPTSDLGIKLDQYSEEINHRVEELVDLKRLVSKQIDQLDKWTHRMVLRERYIHLKKWEEIAVEQNYSYRQTTRLHGEALIEFDKIFEV